MRARLQLENEFFLTREIAASLVGWSMVIWVGIGQWFDVYDRIESAHPRVILRDAFRQCLLGAASVILFQYALRLELSRPFLAMFAGWTWFLLCLFRLNGNRIVSLARREFALPHYVMVVGMGERALRIARELEDAGAYGVRLSGFFSGSDDEPVPPEVDGRYPVHSLSVLPNLLRANVIDEIVFAIDTRRLADLEEVFLLCDEEGVRTRVALDFFPHVNSRHIS